MSEQQYKAGDTVAWTMGDGHVMAGQVTFVGYSSYLLKRVDGSQCEVAMEKCHLAAPDEILEACDFFQQDLRIQSRLAILRGE